MSILVNFFLCSLSGKPIASGGTKPDFVAPLSDAEINSADIKVYQGGNRNWLTIREQLARCAW